MGRHSKYNRRQEYNSWKYVKELEGKYELENEFEVDTYVAPEIAKFIEPVQKKKVKERKVKVIHEVVKIGLMQKIKIWIVRLLNVKEITLDKRSKI